MKLKSATNRILQIFCLLVITTFTLIQCNVIWRSPKSYKPKEQKELEPPIMSLDDYTTSGLIDSHARPYVYEIKSQHTNGAVLVFGAEHTKDPNDNQLQLMEYHWNQFNPTVALVEGRLGFLFSWAQNPVKTLGEGGLTARLAKSKGIKLYSWEPDRDNETEILLKKFDPYHVAAFYCLRPYRGNYSGLSLAESNKVMAGLIDERTNHKGIQGYIHSVQQIDSLWKKDHPDIGDWRTYKHPRNGWPEGAFKQMAEESNSVRDVFMCNSIIDLVTSGERVFITMGSSHAPRIEKTLTANLRSGYATEPDKKDFVITERNLIPEGTAFDIRTKTIYVSSTYKRKIIRIASDGKIEDFIPEKYEGIASVLGIEVDEERGVLWANTAHANEVMPLTDPDPSKDWKTSICSFDLRTKKMIRKFDLHVEKACFNDLTVTPEGDVFITETVNGRIYRINAATDSLELFLQPTGFDFLNGITYSDEYKALFVSSVQGVLKINLPGKDFNLLKSIEGIDAAGIDGLTFYENKLIGHQSSKVSVFHLNENANEIIKSEVLDTGEEFDSSTTGEIGQGYYYFIVNSQIRSGIDRIHHTIKPADSLQNVIIRRIKL